MTYNWPNSAFFNFQEYAKTRELQTIERFHSRDKHLCKFIATKENVYIRKEFNSQRIFSVHQHGRRFVVLEHQYGRRDVMWKRSIFVHSYFFLRNWNQESDEDKIHRSTAFFRKLDNNKWKMHTSARARKEKYISILYLSIWKPFWKWVYIYTYIYPYYYIYMYYVYTIINMESKGCP